MIYKVINKINKKPYIGKTDRTLDERRKEHEKTQSNSLFHKAIRKYGVDNFEWYIEDETGEEEYYIRKYNSHFIDGYGYNMTYGGENYPKEHMDMLWNDPDFKEKHSIATGKATKKSWKNKKTRDRRSKGISKARIKQYKTDEKYKERNLKHIKGLAKRNWESSEYREKVLKSRSKKYKILNTLSNKIFTFYGHEVNKFCEENNLKYDCFKSYLSRTKGNCYKHQWKLIEKS